MSTMLKAKTKENGEVEFGIQQYEVGLYVCIYKNGRVLDQFGLNTTEEEFITALESDPAIQIIR